MLGLSLYFSLLLYVDIISKEGFANLLALKHIKRSKFLSFQLLWVVRALGRDSTRHEPDRDFKIPPKSTDFFLWFFDFQKTAFLFLSTQQNDQSKDL